MVVIVNVKILDQGKSRIRTGRENGTRKAEWDQEGRIGPGREN